MFSRFDKRVAAISAIIAICSVSFALAVGAKTPLEALTPAILIGIALSLLWVLVMLRLGKL